MTEDRLLQYHSLRLELEGIKHQIEWVRSVLDGLKSPQITGMPKGFSSAGSSPGERAVDQLQSLAQLYGRKANVIAEEISEIENAIGSLSDPVERDLCRRRYLEGLMWEDVCDEIGYAWAHTHRIHRRALKKMGVIIKDDTE